MMKKVFALAFATLLTLSTLTACGGAKEEAPAPAEPVDLTAFYNSLAEEYSWDDMSMAPVEGEMFDMSYPGLGELTTNQLIARMPMMSSIVSELVLAECADEETATAVAALLQERATMQAEGGAWYPESMEAWGKAEVIQNGVYVALIAVAEHQDELSTKFNALFA